MSLASRENLLFPGVREEIVHGLFTPSRKARRCQTMTVSGLTMTTADRHRLHTRDIVEYLQYRTGIRPWNENLKKPITDLWLAQQLRPYAIRPKTLRIDGTQA